MSEVIKSGNLLKFTNNAFNTKWKYNYVELCQNSTFRWFEKKGDYSPKRSVNLKDVSAYLAFGDIVKQLPFKPDLQPEQNELVIAIPHDNNRNTRLSFFLCSNEVEIREWINTILNTVTEQPQSYAGTNTQPTGRPTYGDNVPPIQKQTAVPYNTNPPPAYGNSGPPMGGPPPIGFNFGNVPGGPCPPGNPPMATYPPGNPPMGNYPPANPPMGTYAPGPPVGSYAPPYQAPVSYPQNYYPGCAPNQQPTSTQGAYHAGNVPPSSYPRQPGYVPGAPQTYTAGNPFCYNWKQY